MTRCKKFSSQLNLKLTSKEHDLRLGCGSKIGRNIAVAMARMGLKVALVDFNDQQTDSVARECEEQSPKNWPVSRIPTNPAMGRNSNKGSAPHPPARCSVGSRSRQDQCGQPTQN